MEEVNKTPLNQDKIVKEEIDKLFEKIGIKGTFEVETGEDSINVHIDSDENALLIGKHGNTLSSLELILSLIVSRRTGEFKRMIIEVGGYRQAREEYLRDLAGRFRDEVIAQGGEKAVHGLKPWERRVVHMYLSEDPQIISESEGEDRDRVLVIRRK